MQIKKDGKDRIVYGIEKSSKLSYFEELVDYLNVKTKEYGLQCDYDVLANELPYFKTLNYTEYAHCVVIHPLQFELRVQQMLDAYTDDVEQEYSYTDFFRDLSQEDPNKYQKRKSISLEPKKHLVILPGDNKLKQRISIRKIIDIKKANKDDFVIKPHPFTNHATIGELMDLFGEGNVAKRDEDMYEYLHGADVIHTSVLSESAMFAVSLDKEISPIDLYRKTPEGSFYHINRFLFSSPDPKEWVNRTFNSPKSGVICPLLDDNWKEKIDKYLEYISSKRDSYKGMYVE